MVKLFRKIRHQLIDEDEKNENLSGKKRRNTMKEGKVMREGRITKYLIYAIGEIVLVMIGSDKYRNYWPFKSIIGINSGLIGTRNRFW